MKPTGKTEYRPAAQVEYQQVMDGIAMAGVIGDASQGAHGTLVRLAPGVKMPLHHYTAALGGVVLDGKVTHPVPGNEASNSVLESGSYFSFAAGEPHETNNVGDETAVFFIFQDHAWEFVMD